MTPAIQWWQDFAARVSGPLILSDLARRRAEDAFLDTAACLVAGWETQAARSARETGQGVAGRALALATAAHALDFDDYDRASIGHPSAILVPVIFTLSEERPVSGADALAAHVAGLEAMGRMGECVNPEHYARGWHATGTLGTLGAAVAAGRLRRLDAAQMMTALSLAAGTASGLKAQFGSGAKPLNAGFAAMHGVLAAELARAGADARPEAITAFAALTGSDAPRHPGAFGEGPVIERHGLIVKLHPCCGYLGRIIPEAIALGRDVAPEAIADIAVELPARNAAVLAYGIPETPDQARFSVPYCVAAALSQGRLGLGDFTDEAIRRPEIIALAKRVRLVPSSAAQSSADLSPDDPDRIEVVMRDGGAVERVLRDLPGSPDHPATRDQLLAKLADCAAGHAVNGDELAADLIGFGALPDIALLARKLAP